LEIVTEPDMSSAEEVRGLAVELQKIVRYLGISEADMQKGHMRFEPNINLVITKDSKEYKTPIVEVKNLNSFRALERSVAYEEQRQLDEFLETGRVMESGSKTTHGWDDANQVTVLQRQKEEAHDYRYFPDPDLVPVELDDDRLSRIKENLCELPIEKCKRFVSEYKLSGYDAGVLTAEKATSDYFEEIVKAGGEPKRVCNLLTQVGLKLANEKGCNVSELGIAVADFAELVKMAGADKVSATAAVTIMEQMAETSKGPGQIAQELDLLQKSDAGQLEKLVEQVLAENPQAVEDVTGGGKKSKRARGFLLGQVMQKTKGTANPKIVSEILTEKLK